MKQCKWIGAGCVVVVLLMTSGIATSAPRKQTKPTYTRPEYDQYLAAHPDGNLAHKIRLLDDFVGKYPVSTLLPEAYQEYYQAYYAQRNYLETIEYVDKLMALGDKVELGLRLQALTARALAYLADCGDGALQTRDAYMAARDAAMQGRQVMDQLRIPASMTLEQFATQKENLGNKFDAVTQIAEAGLKGQKSDSCKVAAGVSDSTVREPGRFDGLIKQLDNEQRQSPQVR